jgi:hypothetical protein
LIHKYNNKLNNNKSKTKEESKEIKKNFARVGVGYPMIVSIVFRSGVVTY